MTERRGQLRVGTSGWVYRHWRGDFYPADLPQKRWFAWYAERFDTAEINATFYRLPSQAAVAAWREAAPPDFVYAWKASRFITQAKKLRDPEGPLERVYGPMLALGQKLGPALFQLPPQLKRDLPRLEAFLAALPEGRRHVIEFRDRSWYVDEIYSLLQRFGAAFCVSDHHDAPSPWLATASFAYVRGHGPGGHYQGAYSDEDLGRWAEHIARWQAEGREVFAYFDNDIGGSAPRDALRLKARCC